MGINVPMKTEEQGSDMAVTRRQFTSRLKAQVVEAALAQSQHDDALHSSDANLIETILKSVSGSSQKALLERYTKLKSRYFHTRAKALLIQFLSIKQNKNIDDILSDTYRRAEQREFIQILTLFVAGESDALHTVRMFERYYQRHKPSYLRVFALQRHIKLRQFIDSFKQNCLKDIAQCNVGFIPKSSSDVLDEEEQYHSLFSQPMTKVKVSTQCVGLSVNQQQRRSLFRPRGTMPVGN